MGKPIGIVTNQFPVLSETFIVNKVVGLHKAGMNVTVLVSAKRSDKFFFNQNTNLCNIKVLNINDRFKLALNFVLHPIEAINWVLQMKRRMI